MSRISATLQRALTCFNRGDYPAAEQAARAAIAETPDAPETWNLLGVILRSAGRPQESLPCYRNALLLEAEHPGAWTNLGNACKDLGRIKMAIACHRRAIAAQPDRAEMYHNLGLALMAERHWVEAVVACSHSLLLNPNAAEVRWDRAMALLSAGRWAEGCVDYGARIGGPGLPTRPLPGRAWRGQVDRRATVLVAAEQGFGDAIWSWRYLPLLRRRVARVVLECRPEIAPLARAQGFVDQVVEQGEALPAADYHAWQCSLPGFFTPDLATIPPAPYLRIPADRQARVAPLLTRGVGTLRVGIVWGGSPSFKVTSERNAPLSRFVESFNLPGVTLFSLQFGPQRRDLATAGVPIIDLASDLADFADSAAAVAGLDLVIMVDSALAHLCGALGCPVWVLLRYGGYLLWGKESGTPWYRSARLFHQPVRGDWDGVFDAAGAALMEVLQQSA
jgi:Flp pilus assembly protein TadD